MKKAVLKNVSLKIIILLIIALVIWRIYDFSEVQSDDNRTKFELSGATAVPDSKTEHPELEQQVVDFGISFLGTPYVAASCSPQGFDCSGFVYYVFQNFNIEVPRSSIQFRDFGTPVPVREVRKGDILVFLSPTRNEIGHLGIVTQANGQASEFVHASSGKEMSVIISKLSDSGYSRRFVKAVRVL